MITVAHNLAANNTQRQYKISTGIRAKATERLASGYKVNSSADDAAGLKISEKMRWQIRGLNKGSKNTEDGISMLQVADGALGEVQDMLHRLTELSVQAANDTNTIEDRMAIQEEVNRILEEIDNIGENTHFNTQPLFQGRLVPVTNADGSPLIESEIAIGDLSIANISMGQTPFSENSSGSTMGLRAIVDNPDSAAYGKVYNLIYGSGNTSHPKIQISYQNAGGTDVTQQVELANLAVSNYSTNDLDTWERDFTYTNTDGVNLTIHQKIKINNTSKDYEISYDVTNNGAIDADLDFMFHVDTAYNNDDDCEGYFTGGQKVTSARVYTQADSPYTDGVTNSNVNTGMINSVSVVNQDASLSFSEYIAFSGDSPDTVAIGQYNTIHNWDFYDENGFGNGHLGANTNRMDLGFAALWNDSLAAGTTVSHSIIYGIRAVESDPNLQGVTITKDPSVVYVPDPDADWWIQSGCLEGDGYFVTIGEMDTEVLEINGLNVTNHQNASSSITKVQDALTYVNAMRSRIGAQVNRLEYTNSKVQNIAENTQAAESIIRDADMAEEMMNMSASNIIASAGEAMMAQANKINQGVLTLLE